MKPRVPSIIFATLAIVYLTALPNAQAPATPPATPAQVTFARDIQPIIEKSCAGCHSADLKLAELDLSTREAAMKGGEHGAVIVPGSADKSKLYRMVAGLDEPAMPMEGDAAEAAEVAAIKAWIDQGANWERAGQLRQRHSADHGAVVLELPRRGDAAVEARSSHARRRAARRRARPGDHAGQRRAEQVVSRRRRTSTPSRCRCRATKLKPDEIAAVKAWIDQGAPWDVASDAGREAGDERARGAREHGDHAGAAQLLGVQAAGAEDAADRRQIRIFTSDRSVPRKRPRAEEARGGAARRQAHAHPPRVPRPDRPAADAGRSGRVRRGPVRRRVGQA